MPGVAKLIGGLTIVTSDHCLYQIRASVVSDSNEAADVLPALGKPHANEPGWVQSRTAALATSPSTPGLN